MQAVGQRVVLPGAGIGLTLVELEQPEAAAAPRKLERGGGDAFAGLGELDDRLGAMHGCREGGRRPEDEGVGGRADEQRPRAGYQPQC